MAKKSDREMRAFHARQAAQNRNTPPVDNSNIVTNNKKAFRPVLPEDEKELMEAG